MIRALKYRGDEVSDPVPEEAARILGLLGASAGSAVPALIEAVETREEDDRNSAIRVAAALALGEIGPGAKGAIPALHNLMQEQEKKFGNASAEVVIALYELDPGGKAIAEKWLDRALVGSENWSVLIEIEPRAKFRFRTFCRRFANGAAGDFSPGGHARERHFIVRRTQEERSSRLSEKIGDLCNPGFCVVAIRKHAAGFLFQTDTTQCGQKISK